MYSSNSFFSNPLYCPQIGIQKLNCLKLQYEDFRIFILKLQAVQYVISKFSEEWIASWYWFPSRQSPTDSSLLHSRQNQKQIKCMHKIKNSKWWQFPHQTTYIVYFLTVIQQTKKKLSPPSFIFFRLLMKYSFYY